MTTAYQQSDFRRYSCVAALVDEVHGDPHVLRWDTIFARETKLLPTGYEVKSQGEGLLVPAVVAASFLQAGFTGIVARAFNTLLDGRTGFAEQRRCATPFPRHCTNLVFEPDKALEIRLALCTARHKKPHGLEHDLTKINAILSTVSSQKFKTVWEPA